MAFDELQGLGHGYKEGVGGSMMCHTPVLRLVL